MISMYWFNHFLDARAETRDFFSLDFGRIVDTIMSFWNFLTFRCDVTPHQTKVDKLFRTTTLCMSCHTSGPDDMYMVVAILEFRAFTYPVCISFLKHIFENSIKRSDLINNSCWQNKAAEFQKNSGQNSSWNSRQKKHLAFHNLSGSRACWLLKTTYSWLSGMYSFVIS